MALSVVIVNYAYDPRFATPERTLAGLVALPEFASGLRAAGVEVRVVQRYQRDATLCHAGVGYEFVADGGRARPRTVDACLPVARRAAGLGAQVAHVNGLVFPLQTRLLRARLGRGTALVAQHHAERPWRGWRGALQRWGLAPVKDPLTLLAGFELLLEAQPAAHLTMVYGEADLLPQVEARLAASARLRERVTFHGFRTQAELAGFYRAAQLLVVTSRHEAGPVVALEAAAWGVPSVGSHVGHLADGAGSWSATVPPGGRGRPGSRRAGAAARPGAARPPRASGACLGAGQRRRRHRAALRGAVPAAAGRRRLGARRGGGGSGAGRSVAGAFAPGFRTATSETLGCSGS